MMRTWLAALACLLLISCAPGSLPPEPGAPSIAGKAFAYQQGYAPPADVFDDVQVFFITPSEVPTGDPSTMSFEVRVDHPGGFVYNKGYIYHSVLGWQPYTFPDTTVFGSNWIADEATYTTTLDKASLDEETYVLAYSCKKHDNQWKCGCQTTAGPCDLWMLQILRQAELPPEPAPPASTTKFPVTIILPNANDYVSDEFVLGVDGAGLLYVKSYDTVIEDPATLAGQVTFYVHNSGSDDEQFLIILGESTPESATVFVDRITDWFSGLGIAYKMISNTELPAGDLKSYFPGTFCLDTDNSFRYTAPSTDVNSLSRPDLFIAGNVGAQIDACIDATTLQESYCNGNSPVTAQVTCPNGCDDGECKRDTPCVCGTAGYQLNAPYCTTEEGYFGSTGATWTCADGTTGGSTESNPPVCKPGRYWQELAKTSCAGKCNIGGCSPCIDPDGGKNYGVDGALGIAHYDQCQNSAQAEGILEFFCADQYTSSWVTRECSGGCLNGVCAGTASRSPCTDSDKANDLYAHGMAITRIQRNLEDQCIEDKFLGQADCEATDTEEGEGAALIETVCPEGCSGGVCQDVENTCTDSDGGKNYDVKGQTQFPDELASDFCFDYDAGLSCEGGGNCQLAEHFCKSTWDSTYGYGGKEKVTCPNGCKDGACQPSVTPQYTCTDSDNGLNYAVKGVINTDYPSWLPDTPDVCTTQQSPGSYLNTASCSGSLCYLHEYTCNTDGTPQHNFQLCSSGCADGACP